MQRSTSMWIYFLSLLLAAGMTLALLPACGGGYLRHLPYAITRHSFQKIQKDWYTFGDGELGPANNALAQGKSAELSPDLTDLVQRSLKLRQLSAGFFDPTIGMLVELWGFHDTESTRVTPPPEADIQRWQANLPARKSLKVY